MITNFLTDAAVGLACGSLDLLLGGESSTDVSATMAHLAVTSGALGGVYGLFGKYVNKFPNDYAVKSGAAFGAGMIAGKTISYFINTPM